MSTARPCAGNQRPAAIRLGHVDPAPTRTVHYGDLDLASADGRQTLTRRVRGAVRSLCGVKPASPLSEAIIHRDCATSAWNRARPQIDAAIDGRGLAARSGGIVVATLRQDRMTTRTTMSMGQGAVTTGDPGPAGAADHRRPALPLPRAAEPSFWQVALAHARLPAKCRG